MSLNTAKSILSSFNLLSQQQVDRKRKPKNEFQAYAYRLAHDLKDLQNLKIYMMLAKSVDRSLMERAYSFVADSTSQEKGKLFLWKLKLLRKEIEKRRNLNNFSYSYVLENTKLFRNTLAKNIIEKTDLEFSKELRELINKLFINEDPSFVSNSNSGLKSNKKYKNLLIIGNSSKKLINILLNYRLKINTFDISIEINKSIKNSIKLHKNLKNIKILTRDFLKNKCKDKTFDYLIIFNYWQLIPQDSEISFLKEIQRVSKSSSKMLINIKHSLKEGQKWGEFPKNKNETISYFTKSINRDSLDETLSKFDYKLTETNKINGFEYLNYQYI